ncbi:MAG: HD domain-containing phosphohydrolase [Janthinobacterium lividum]
MAPIAPSLQTDEVKNHAKSIFQTQRQDIYRRTDRLFALLMALQWAGAIIAAYVVSPRTWTGSASQVHPHVWAALFLGGLVSIFPICLALACPGQAITRQVIAVAQLLMSSLLIHITGGQETTHFHIFGSLAFLAFYRDWRVLVTATLVTATDHLVQGAFWSQSIYGLAAAAPLLTAEHIGWVAFEDVFLLVSCRQSLQEMHQISLRQAQLEVAEEILLKSHETLETRVEQRTRALAQMQRQNELLLNSAGEGIYGIDSEGITQFVNPMGARLLGYQVEEIIGQPMHALLHHTRRNGTNYPSSECPIYQSMKNGEVQRRDGDVFWRKDGTSFDVEYISTPLHDEDCVVGAVITFQDITERKRSEMALQDSEARYRGLVECSPEAIVVYSGDHFVYVNAAAVTLFAASCAEDLVGRLIFDVVHPDYHVLTRKRAYRSQEEGKSSPLTQQKYVRLDGIVFDVEAVSTSIVYQGKPAGQVLIRDISERKKAEANILALNAELASAYQDTLNAYDATIEGLSRALDYRDQETHGHSERVTTMMLRMAQVFDYSEEDLTQVRRGALLHDIGKMAVPDSILHKPGPLTAEERTVMCRHTEYAREMLWPIAFLRPALDIPYCHHEKWDGTGYPRGLRGEEIPLAARLFAIVDVWDALSSDRPYRKAWPQARVLDHIRSLSGTHFDPALVPVFLKLADSEQDRTGEQNRTEDKVYQDAA